MTPEQRIAEIAMAHIYKCTDGNQNKQHIKFSRGTLRDTILMVDDSFNVLQVNRALDYLVDSKHLKKLGAHLYGLGNGKGLKRYKVSDDALMAKPYDPGFNNVKATKKFKQETKKQAAEKAEAATPTPAPAIEEPPSQPAQATEAEPEQVTTTPALVQIANLRKRLATQWQAPAAIDTKIAVLKGLAEVLSDTAPDVSITLSEIEQDLLATAKHHEELSARIPSMHKLLDNVPALLQQQGE